ncbi:MAG: hypothetical protein K2M08_05110 [Anaeroplasmataceae bacterium]|nr:hypothetical protein [Anaeroplasmataceae bacterium]
MQTIFAAIVSIAKTIGNAVKKFFIAIKNVLILTFRPIADYIAIFIQIKNFVAWFPILLYGIVFYPVNHFFNSYLLHRKRGLTHF